MTLKTVTVAGFYGGKFLKPGASYPVDTRVEATPQLDSMTKDELIAEADKRGVSVKSSDPKAEILAALKAAEAEAAE